MSMKDVLEKEYPAGTAGFIEWLIGDDYEKQTDNVCAKRGKIIEDDRQLFLW
jgi:hypothetical protein